MSLLSVLTKLFFSHVFILVKEHYFERDSLENALLRTALLLLYHYLRTELQFKWSSSPLTFRTPDSSYSFQSRRSYLCNDILCMRIFPLKFERSDIIWIKVAFKSTIKIMSWWVYLLPQNNFSAIFSMELSLFITLRPHRPLSAARHECDEVG